MLDFDKVYTQHKDDIDAVEDLCNKLYNDNFFSYFKEIKELHKRLSSKTKPITDDELEWVLISLPLELLDASEKLSQFKLELEVLKLKYKQQEFNLVESSQQTTQTRKKEEAELVMIEDKLLITCYGSVITRVENQITLSKELIMGSKKIFDSRKAAENAYPVSESSVMYTQEQYEKSKQNKEVY